MPGTPPFEQGLPAIPADVLEPLAREFRHAVLAGLASVPRIPGPKHSTKQKPGRELLEFCRDRRDDALRFATDTTIWPTNDLASYCTSWVRSAVSGVFAVVRSCCWSCVEYCVWH